MIDRDFMLQAALWAVGKISKYAITASALYVGMERLNIKRHPPIVTQEVSVDACCSRGFDGVVDLSDQRA